MPASPAVFGSKGLNSQRSAAWRIHKEVWHFKCLNSWRRLKNIAGKVVSKLEGSKQMKNLFVRLWKEEEGQDLTEYGLLLVLIALAAVAAMGKLASAISQVFVNASGSLS
jgi:pilus assembly protein Flp/PilA